MIRVNLLSAGKIAALALFVAIAMALGVYLFGRDRHASGIPSSPKLQGRVVAVFNNTRYAHEVEGHVRFVLNAGVDKTYEDGTHELEQVRLESSGADGSRNDVVTADRAQVSNPSDLNKLDAEFISNVVVQTSDGLTIKTNYLRYDQAKNTVETKEPVRFESRTLSGSSTGFFVEASEERVHLLEDVDVTIKPDTAASGDKVKSGKAAAAQSKEKRRNETPEQKAARKARKRERKLQRKLQQRRLLAEAEQEKSGSANAGAKSKYSPVAAKLPTRIRSRSALLEKKDHRVTFTGGVLVTQGKDEMRADRMVGYLNDASRIERIEARGNSYLKQQDKAEIKSADMDFFFDDAHRLLRAIAVGGAYTRSLGIAPLREARADTIEATFVAGPQDNLVDVIKAQGNAAVHIHAPAPASDKTNPAERELTADAISLQFFPDGRNVKSAEAVGNAVMTVTPTRAERNADKKTIRAPQMNAIFYEEGDRLKNFAATGGVKVEVEAMVAGAHPPRVTTSNNLTADFLADSQDLERTTQEGDFKYNEGDRNATAERAVYDDQAELLALRGKRPMAWDLKARTQADEIDYDRRNDETRARGDVRTTYYSRETTNDSTPFKNAKSPVFITAARADARNKDDFAVYTGNARGWQDDNFVKADRIEMYQKDKRMIATGHVESALYTVERESSPGKREVVPGFATADRMTYSDSDRLVHYDGSVKARQGADRIDAQSADVYLKKDANEIDRLLAEGEVVLLQPGRRGTGDKLTYTASDGRAVLVGKSAQVVSDEQGTTMGAQLTFYSRDDKIFVDNQQGTSRVRSTHRLTKNKE